MPEKRTRLIRAQQAKYLERAQELQAAGVDCEIPIAWEENGRSLDIFVAPHEGNILCELSNGITACAIGVDILALTGNLILKEFSIVSEWGSEFIALCPNAKGLFRVGSAFEFAELETLNHRIENGLRFSRRGDAAAGWLLASSNQPIPDEYRPCMITELRLTFTDQFGHCHSAQAQATLQRSGRLKDADFRVPKSESLWAAENGLDRRKDAER
jgi:hypothetical protein